MITVTIDDREIVEALRRLAATGRDMSPVMADIAVALLSESERQFQREAGPLGHWEYRKHKRSIGSINAPFAAGQRQTHGLIGNALAVTAVRS